MATRKRIAILLMGGTIAMVPDPVKGYLRPAQNAEEFEIAIRPIVQNFKNSDPNLDFDFFCLSTVDSVNINAEMLEELAAFIHAHRHDYSAFVVPHGTDTLAETAATLSRQFQSLTGSTDYLAAPVILAGAQKTIHTKPSDAESNLSSSIQTALFLSGGNDEKLYYPLVAVAFANKVFDGAHVLKIDDHRFDAFKETNPLTLIGETTAHGFESLHLDRYIGLTETQRLQKLLDLPDSIDTMRMMISPLDDLGDPLYYIHRAVPSQLSSTSSFTLQAAHEYCLGLVIELAGQGNTGSKNFPAITKSVRQFGLPVIGALGIAGGSADMTGYESGTEAFNAGILPSRASVKAAEVVLTHLMANNVRDIWRIAASMGFYRGLAAKPQKANGQIIKPDELPADYVNSMPTWQRRLDAATREVDDYRMRKHDRTGGKPRFLMVSEDRRMRVMNALPRPTRGFFHYDRRIPFGEEKLGP